MSEKTFVIVGASLAGAKAAEELRERGFDGRVMLVGTEAEPPYERPPLSKDYLRGESERSATHVHEDGYYEQHGIELLAGTTVTAIDPAAGQVTLDGHRTLEFDRLLLSTGSEPRRLQVEGAARWDPLPAHGRRLRRAPPPDRRGRARRRHRRRLDRVRGCRVGAPA